MNLSPVDEREVLTALHSAAGPPPFGVFLERFRRRVGAREALLIEHRHRGGWIRWRRQAAQTAELEGRFRQALHSLRPGRAYDVQEINPYEDEGGRVVRSTSVLGDQWLIALGPAGEFSAADGALMGGLAAHVSIACENQARLEAARTDLAAAQAALDRAGVGWSLLDRQAEPVSGAEPPASQLQLTDLTQQITAGACRALAGAVLAVDAPQVADGRSPEVLALFRVARKAQEGAAVFAAEHSLPMVQAQLAVLLADGAALAEAAPRLGLTLETVRNYSKRLYAQTGARGQPDLVRLVWTGLAPLA